MKNYYFVFCKGDIMLEKLPDGNYTIPCQEMPPTEVKPWTNVMNVTPIGHTEVNTYRLDSPGTDAPR